MPSRRTRKRRGHHHPTRLAQWRRSIDQPPRERLTRASTTPGARLQRTPVRTHRSPSAVPVHERRTGTYAPIAERRTGTHVPIAERDSPHRDVEVAPLRARPWVISASSRPHLASSRPHLGLTSASSRLISATQKLACASALSTLSNSSAIGASSCASLSACDETHETSHRRSEGLGGDQRQSEAIRGNQRRSKARRGDQGQSKAIKGHQGPSSEAIATCDVSRKSHR